MKKKTALFLTLLAILSVLSVRGCSIKKQNAGDFEYELMSMQERGRIDPTIMARALADPDSRIRELALRTCGIVRDKRFTATIDSLCAEGQPEISSAVFALGEIKDSSSVYALYPLISSDDRQLRAIAINALGKIGNPAAADTLRALLFQPEFRHSEIPLSLWRLNDTLSAPEFNRMALDFEAEDCYGAAYALFRLAPEFGTNVFLANLSCASDTLKARGEIEFENCERLQPICARGLGDGKDTTAILQAFDNYYDSIVLNARIELVRAMGRNKIGRERLERKIAETDNNGLKRVILTALGEIGDARSIDIITAYIHDPSLQIKLASIASLPQMKKRKAMKVLDELSNDPLWQIRAGTARALGNMGSNAAEKKLKEMLTDRDERVKAAVIEGLGEYSVLKNIDIFEAALLGSSDVVIRAIAADILGRSKQEKPFELLTKAAAEIDSAESADYCRSLVAALGYYVDSTDTGRAAVAAIAPFLSHLNRTVRQDAAAAMREFVPANFDPGEFDVVLDRKYFDLMMSLVDKQPAARINTSRGEIAIELAPREAPRTVANFVRLAERKFYDGLTFHRVVEDFVVQGGCPRGDGWGDPGYMIREEINPIEFQAGTIGMATSGRDTGGSQFFICLSAQPHLDGRYTAFGSLTEGWDVLNRIELGDTIYAVTIEYGR